MDSASRMAPGSVELGRLDAAVDGHLQRARPPRRVPTESPEPRSPVADDQMPAWALELRDAICYLAERVAVLERTLADAVADRPAHQSTTDDDEIEARIRALETGAATEPGWVRRLEDRVRSLSVAVMGGDSDERAPLA